MATGLNRFIAATTDDSFLSYQEWYDRFKTVDEDLSSFLTEALQHPEWVISPEVLKYLVQYPALKAVALELGARQGMVWDGSEKRFTQDAATDLYNELAIRFEDRFLTSAEAETVVNLQGPVPAGGYAALLMARAMIKRNPELQIEPTLDQAITGETQAVDDKTTVGITLGLFAGGHMPLGGRESTAPAILSDESSALSLGLYLLSPENNFEGEISGAFSVNIFSGDSLLPSGQIYAGYTADIHEYIHVSIGPSLGLGQFDIATLSLCRTDNDCPVTIRERDDGGYSGTFANGDNVEVEGKAGYLGGGITTLLTLGSGKGFQVAVRTSIHYEEVWHNILTGGLRLGTTFQVSYPFVSL